ncbi:hypothetical protein HPB52_004808 [Rhipicephalus sanguineus]|uniref:Tick transposon n=1 Tax=Rhipicephalus sanguineus TaxID=34632 RepID=A0A9D4SND4_RHISA|nr:hypothetical protein HPB52_004808 [Rhipicephalus sanguineus]
MLGEQLRIIEEAEKRNGATKASIARDLNIPESSLKTILAKKHSILLNAAKFGLNRKAAKDGKYAAMEKALVEWLRQARSSGIAVDGAILKEKAETVALHCAAALTTLKPTMAGWIALKNAVELCTAAAVERARQSTPTL